MRRVLVAASAVVVVSGALAVVHAARDQPSGMTASQLAAAERQVDDTASGRAADTPASASSTTDDVEGNGDGASAVDDATRAAVAAVARTREVIEGGAISRRDVIAEFATTEFAPALAERTTQQWVGLLFGLRRAAGRAVAVQLLAEPVTAAAEPISADRVVVQVWTVTVIVADGQSPVPEQWSTVRMEMVDEQGRWLVDRWDVSPGPSPTPAPEGSFASADEVAAVMAWPTATTGDS